MGDTKSSQAKNVSKSAIDNQPSQPGVQPRSTGQVASKVGSIDDPPDVASQHMISSWNPAKPGFDPSRFYTASSIAKMRTVKSPESASRQKTRNNVTLIGESSLSPADGGFADRVVSPGQRTQVPVGFESTAAARSAAKLKTLSSTTRVDSVV